MIIIKKDVKMQIGIIDTTSAEMLEMDQYLNVSVRIIEI